MLRKLLISAFFTIPFSIQAMDTSSMERADDEAIRRTLNSFKLQVDQWFNDIEDHQLHLYWTTGQERSSLKQELGAKHEVYIGGKDYFTTFPRMVKLLLECLPSKLKVKLIIDDLTRSSNKEWLDENGGTYQDRFDVVDINDVANNLRQVFPECGETIGKAFRHAQRGNPVIPSDVYRVVGMPFLKSAHDWENKRITYCDIDTLVENLMVTERIRGFLEDAFSPFKVDAEIPGVSYGFYCDNSQSTVRFDNNLMKLEIKNFEAYRKVCCEVFNYLSQPLVPLQFFSTLYDSIELSRTDVEKGFKNYLSLFQRTQEPTLQFLKPGNIYSPNMIMQTTGSLLRIVRAKDENLFRLHSLNSHMSPASRTWCFNGFMEDPVPLISSFSASSLINNETSEKQENLGFLPQTVIRDLLGNFSIYNAHCEAAFFARKFGQEHPFFKTIQAYISKKSLSFLKSLKVVNELYYWHDAKKGYAGSIDEWLKEQIKIFENPESTHQKIRKALQERLGVSFYDLDTKYIDFRALSNKQKEYRKSIVDDSLTIFEGLPPYELYQQVRLGREKLEYSKFDAYFMLAMALSAGDSQALSNIVTENPGIDLNRKISEKNYLVNFLQFEMPYAYEALKLFLENGLNLANTKDSHGVNVDFVLWKKAALSEKIDIMKLLHEQGEMIVTREDRWNLAYTLSITKKTSVMEYLIREGMDINATGGRYSSTLLHNAIKRDCVLMAGCLLNNGADVSIIDGDGLTPFKIADSDQMRTLLRSINTRS